MPQVRAGCSPAQVESPGWGACPDAPRPVRSRSQHRPRPAPHHLPSAQPKQHAIDIPPPPLLIANPATCSC